MAKTARHDEQQLRLFQEDSLYCHAPDSGDPGDGATSAPNTPTPDRSSTKETRGTVSFVGPDGYDVPVGALRRIVGLMIDQAQHSSGLEAS